MRRRHKVIAGAAAVALAVGGTVAARHGHHQAKPTIVLTTSALVLPNHNLHPGATNPNVTQANIGSTICVSGWTTTVRPPVSYTTPLKQREIAAEHLPGTPADYEEDHLIPLELGGNPTSPANLWPEPWESRGAGLAKAGTGAETKDRTENRLRAEVCASTLPLATAQQEIATNWETAR